MLYVIYNHDSSLGYMFLYFVICLVILFLGIIALRDYKRKNPFVIILVALSTLYLLGGLILYHISPKNIEDGQKDLKTHDYKFKDNALLGPLYNWLLASKDLPNRYLNAISIGTFVQIFLLAGLIFKN